MKKAFRQRLYAGTLLCGLLFGAMAAVAQPYTRQGFTEEGSASFYANKFHGRTTASGEKFNMYAMTAAHKKIPFNSIIKVTNLRNGKWVTLRVNDRGPFSPNRIVDVSKAAALKLDMVSDGIADVKIELLRVGGEPSDPSASGLDATAPDKAAPKKEVVKTEEKKEEPAPKKELAKDKTPPKKEVAKTQPTKKEPVTNRPAVKDAVKKSEITTKQLLDPKTNPIEKIVQPIGTYSVYGYVKTPKGYGVQIGTYSDVENAAELGLEAIENELGEIYLQAGYTKGKPVYRVIYGAEKTEEAARELLEDAIEAGFPGAFVRAHFLR